MKRINFFTILLIIFFSSNVLANNYQLKQITSNLGVVWGMTFIDDSQILFTERQGKVGIIDLSSQQVRYLKGVPKVLAFEQGGLLDVVKAPQHQENPWFYFTYSKPFNWQGSTTLSRARLNDESLTDWQDLLISQSISERDIHYGSRIAFDDQNHVFFSVGDRGHRPNAQDLSNHAGSIIRLNLDGSVPQDNPFVGTKDALPEIWSYGHRNPQGLVWDFEHRRLFSIEHGPRGGDEINLIEKGKNYGWPIISYGKEYWAPIAVGEGTHKEGMEQPIKVYTPSIAPGDLMYYTGDAFKQWQGNLFVTALKLQHINLVGLDAQTKPISEQRLFEHLNERIRAIIQNSKGWIYFSTDSGKIYVIQPK